MAPRKNVGKGKGDKKRRDHQDCTLGAFPAGVVRLCLDGVNGDGRFSGWQFCSRGRHCRPPADFLFNGRTDWAVCRHHLQQSQAKKANGNDRRATPAPRGPKTRPVLGPKTPRKIACNQTKAGSTSARGRRKVVVKEESPTPLPRQTKKSEEVEGLFVSSDEEEEEEDDEVDDDVDDTDDHPPPFTRRRTPDDDDYDGGCGFDQNMGDLTGQLLAAH
ncbi:hypothetical protein CPLU01_05653 [Colletotrichum plurivorum]|uniref:Uncharacterized protein n=1 Tax=Colletotrichum plurivorum TaxID=2175906 RepID=A0A8H6KKP9_9PEZI|nr:hypothetical protein CPLU01_05653 [Colletotrichum plurivorum]